MFHYCINYLFCLVLSLSISPCIVSGLECYCEGDGCPENHVNDTCIAPKNSKCFASVREDVHEQSGHREEIYSYGCLPADESTIMQCKGNLVPHRMRTTIICCDEMDFCNRDLDPELKPLPTTPPPVVVPDGGFSSTTVTIACLLVLFAVLLFSLGIYIFYCYRKRKNQGGDRLSRLENQALVNPLKLFTSSNSQKELPEQSMTSGSGSGFPLLVQSTVARQLQFIKNIGKGRYGEVWHARFRDEDVAVKIFSTLDEASWESERELYQTCMLRHENILGFIAADIGGTGSCTQMLLITDFHKASLYDYLREMKDMNEQLSPNTMLKMAHTIACGLSHLHMGIVGTNAKPAIAHRDIKSKNILVKLDGVTCVLADFGLAIRESVSKEILCDTDKRQGTRRYMAPEILDYTIQKNNFESFKMADVYSLSLVFWELARCTSINGKCEGYELPFYDVVGSDPSFDEMRDVICNHKIRPKIAENWTKAEPAKDARLWRIFGKLMIECWSPIPSARLTALRIKKTLSNFHKQDSS